MQQGATFGSDLFRNSILVTSPEGITFHGNDPVWDNPTGQYGPPFDIALDLHDDSHTISLSAIGESDTVPPFYNGPGTLEGKIYEYFPSGDVTFESGWWSYQQIPEPSSLGFVGAIAVALAALRRQRATMR